MSEVFEQVMAQCARGCFTGLLRIQTQGGSGEIRFLSGIQDEIRFDALEGDAALARLQAAEEPEFEAIQSLPPIEPNGTTPVPIEGGLDRFHAAQLMRYCESNSLTCALELEALGKILTARYRLGELLSVEPDSELTSQLAEAKQGLYRFRLPRFELPANARQTRPGAAPAAVVAAAAAPVASAARNEPAFAVAAPGRGAASPAPKVANGGAQRAPTPGLHTRPTPVATPAAHARHSAPTPVSTPAPRISPQPVAPLGQPVAAKPKGPFAAAVSSAPGKIVPTPAAPVARAAGSARPAARAAQPSQSPVSAASNGSAGAAPAARAAAPAAAVRAEAATPAASLSTSASASHAGASASRAGASASPAASASASAAQPAQSAARPATGANQAASPRRAPAPAADRAAEPVVRPVPKAAPRAPQVVEAPPSQHRLWLTLAALVALALAGWVAFGAHLPGRG